MHAEASAVIVHRYCTCAYIHSPCAVRFSAAVLIRRVYKFSSRDDHGNGIPNGNGNPMGFPWEWELVTKLGMRMGRNGKQPVWEWE